MIFNTKKKKSQYTKDSGSVSLMNWIKIDPCDAREPTFAWFWMNMAVYQLLNLIFDGDLYIDVQTKGTL